MNWTSLISLIIHLGVSFPSHPIYWNLAINTADACEILVEDVGGGDWRDSEFCRCDLPELRQCEIENGLDAECTDVHCL